MQYNGPPFDPEEINQMAQSLIDRYGDKRKAVRHAMERQNNSMWRRLGSVFGLPLLKLSESGDRNGLIDHQRINALIAHYPKWDQAFGDLYAQVEQARTIAARKGTAMARSRKPAKRASKATAQRQVRLYTLYVFIISGPVSEKFAKKNPVVSRTIQIRGDQTLEDLHHAIFDACGRWEEHMYEFQFGKRPIDPKSRRYVLPNALEIQKEQPNPPIGRVDQTTIDSLGLKVGDRFGYWFDFGDDWWHQINVEAIENKVPRAKLPKVTKKVGKNPPQYADEDE